MNIYKMNWLLANLAEKKKQKQKAKPKNKTNNSFLAESDTGQASKSS